MGMGVLVLMLVAVAVTMTVFRHHFRFRTKSHINLFFRVGRYLCDFRDPFVRFPSVSVEMAHFILSRANERMEVLRLDQISFMPPSSHQAKDNRHGYRDHPADQRVKDVANCEQFGWPGSSISTRKQN